MKRKVLFAMGGEVYPHITGGMEIFNYNLIRELKSHLDIFYTSTEPLDYPGVHHLKVSKIRPQKFFAPAQVLYYLLRHRDIRSLVLSYSEASWILWYLYGLVVKLTGVKCTIVIHYGKPEVGSHKEAVGKLFKCADTVIAVSRDIKVNYDRAFGIDCRVVYPAIRFSESTASREDILRGWNIPSGAFVVSMIGSLKTMKNPDTLLECLHSFSADELERINPYVVFAGGGHMRQSLEEAASAYGLSDRVRFLGVVPQERVCEVLAASDCYVSASDFEGTSVSLMEAMACRVPVVVADVPGLNDMIEDGVSGLYFTRRDALSLGKAISRYAGDRTCASQMSSCAYSRYLEKYAVSRVIDEYLSIL